MKGNPVIVNGLKHLPKNLSDCPILFNSILDSFILRDEPFQNPLQSFEICVKSILACEKNYFHH